MVNQKYSIFSSKEKSHQQDLKKKLFIHLDNCTRVDFLTLNLASPKRIRSWAERYISSGYIVGEVTTADTFNYRTFKPEMGGLFCERIFGPIADWECHCKRYICVYTPGKVCESCGVELTESRVRRHRMGFIELVSPAAHLWFLKGLPSYLSLLLELPLKDLEQIIYCSDSLVEEIEEIKEVKEKVDTSRVDKTQTEYDEETARLERASLEDFIQALDEDYKVHKSILEVEKSYGFDEISTDEEFFIDLDIVPSDSKLELSRPLKLKKLLGQKKSGAFLIQKLLNSLDLSEEIIYMRQRLVGSLENSKIKYIRASKRLRILESFYITKTNPKWMILTCIPVLPPDLRPMLELSGGQLVSSDLNELYRTLIHRNNRLCDILQMGGAPEVIIRNEKRLLQQAVDSLIDNNKLDEQAYSAHNDRPLRSLAEVIEGKYGRFRQNLLGKRVDYSGRSVIVVGPSLRLNQCGLPFDIITELFQCQIADTLISLKIVKNIQTARSLAKIPGKIMLTLIRYLLFSQPILLNRAPTLHRLGVQAFDPIFVPGQAIHLHPLVCSAFNADFDGDQMGIHIPLSTMSKMEAKYLMRSSYNLLSPADGSPIFKPSQDMVIGCYYLTLQNDFSSHHYRGHYFSSLEDVIYIYSKKKLSLHMPIWVRYFMLDISYNKVEELVGISFSKISDENKIYFVSQQFQILFDPKKNYLASYIRTTPGRVIFNTLLTDSIKSC